MKELMHAHEAKRLTDDINYKEIDDIKTAITSEIIKMVSEGRYEAFIFFESSNYKYKDEIIEWLENKGYKVRYEPGNQRDVPELHISWKE